MAVEHDPPAAYDDLNIRSIALVGGVGAVLTFVAIVAVQVIYFRYNDEEYQQKVLEVPTRQADATLVSQRDRIETSGPGADPEKGEKRIPIEAAMAAVVTDYEQRQSDSAGTDARPATPNDDPASTETEPAQADQPAPE